MCENNFTIQGLSVEHEVVINRFSIGIDFFEFQTQWNYNILADRLRTLSSLIKVFETMCISQNKYEQLLIKWLELYDNLWSYVSVMWHNVHIDMIGANEHNKSYSHTFLIDNHVRLHSSQNASYTEDVCDMHLRLTAKPHLCVICGTFHTEVSTHLPLCSTHNLLIKR